MKCPKCGNELRPSQKEPEYMLCYDCKKKFKVPAKQPLAAPAKKSAPAKPAANRQAANKPSGNRQAVNRTVTNKQPVKKSRYEDDLYDDYDDAGGTTGSLKTWKLVSGILSIILFVFVTFQSCAAGVVNTLSESGDVSGSAGLLVAVMLLTGGIVSIATRKRGNGGNIALIILYVIGAVIGFTMAGKIYKDLYIWAGWCVLCALMALVSFVKNRRG